MDEESLFKADSAHVPPCRCSSSRKLRRRAPSRCAPQPCNCVAGVCAGRPRLLASPSLRAAMHCQHAYHGAVSVHDAVTLTAPSARISWGCLSTRCCHTHCTVSTHIMGLSLHTMLSHSLHRQHAYHGAVPAHDAVAHTAPSARISWGCPSTQCRAFGHHSYLCYL